MQSQKENSSRTRNFSLDLQFCRRLWMLLRIMFPSIFSTPVLLFAFLFALSVLDQVVTYFVGVLPSEFYVVLGNRDQTNFHVLAWKALLIVLAKALILSTIKYSTLFLNINWRRLLCHALHRVYFKDNTYYHMNVLQNQIDNVDQRITQDVERTCQLLAEIFWPLIIQPFVIGYYTYKTYESSGYLGPVSIYAYFIVGTFVNKLIMSPLVNIVVEQERKEGDFRYKHMAIRSHSEAIGFYRAGPLEESLCNESLHSLLTTQSRLINWQYALQFSTKCFDYIGSILSYMIIAIPIFVMNSYVKTDAVELTGVVSRYSFFYMYLINSFSQIIDLSSKFSQMAGTAHRVAELMETMQRHVNETQSDCSDEFEKAENNTEKESSKAPLVMCVDSKNENDRESKSLLKMSSQNSHSIAYQLCSLTFTIPNSTNILVRGLSLSIRRGECLLITGDSSSGKTSLLRVIAGLWRTIVEGECNALIQQRYFDVMFMPQKPYFPAGTLRQQVVYPVKAAYAKKSDQTCDEKVITVLRLVQMEHLVEKANGLDVRLDWNWNDILSPGEMQRLSFARLLYHRPKYAFLDEVTSAIGFDLEHDMYAALAAAGVHYCSVGHRESLRRYHQKILHLDGYAGWTVADLPECQHPFDNCSYLDENVGSTKL